MGRNIVLWDDNERARFAEALRQSLRKAPSYIAAIRSVDQAALGVAIRTPESIREDRALRRLLDGTETVTPPPAAARCERCAELDKKLLDEQVRALGLEEELAQHRSAPSEAVTFLAVLQNLIERAMDRRGLARAPAPEPQQPLPAPAVAAAPAASPSPAELRALPQPPESGARDAPKRRLPRIGLIGVYEEQGAEVAERMARRCEVVFIERRMERSAMPNPAKLDWLVIDTKWLSHADEQRWRTAMGKRFTRCTGGITTVVRTIAEVCDALAREEVA